MPKSSGFKMKGSPTKILAPGQHPNVGRGSGSRGSRSRAPGQRPNVGRGRNRRTRS